jgi:hypothetical protein
MMNLIHACEVNARSLPSILRHGTLKRGLLQCATPLLTSCPWPSLDYKKRIISPPIHVCNHNAYRVAVLKVREGLRCKRNSILYKMVGCLFQSGYRAYSMYHNAVTLKLLMGMVRSLANALERVKKHKE